MSTTESIEKYQQYLSVLLIIATSLMLTHAHDRSNKVEARGNFVSRKKTRGNENRRWHGTMRTCNIGDEGVTKFCLNRSCSLCSIMKTSFDRSFSVGHGMFGTGIYTSATSSKFVPETKQNHWGGYVSDGFAGFSGQILFRATSVLPNGRQCC